jgi:hypothetical protein
VSGSATLPLARYTLNASQSSSADPTVRRRAWGRSTRKTMLRGTARFPA